MTPDSPDISYSYARTIPFDNNQLKYKFKYYHTYSTATKVIIINVFIAPVIQYLPRLIIQYNGFLAKRVRVTLLARKLALLDIPKAENNVSIS